MDKPTGVLWFDDDKKKDWRQKVREAAARHQSRLWLPPDTCYVNPGTVQADAVSLNEPAFVGTVDGIQVYACHDTLPHHFFVFRSSQALVTNGAEPGAQNVTKEAQQLTLL